MPAMLRDAPSLPDGCEPTWQHFMDLHQCRQMGQAGPSCITFLELDAWGRVTGETLAQWQLEAIRKADSAYLTSYAERAKPHG